MTPAQLMEAARLFAEETRMGRSVFTGRMPNGERVMVLVALGEEVDHVERALGADDDLYHDFSEEETP